MSVNAIAAEILEKSASAFARQTGLRLKTALAGNSLEVDLSATDWQADALQRIADLVASLRLNQPDLFVEKAQWLARAYAARGVPVEVPRSALRSLRETLAEDFPEQSAAAVVAIVDKAIAALEQPLDPIETQLDTGDTHDALALRYLAAAIEGLTDDAVAVIVDAIDDGLSPEAAITRVIIPAQHEVGNMWHRNELSVAQEHLVSNTTIELLAIIANRFHAKQKIDRKVVIASVSGNPHDIGVKATAVVFRLAGWQTINVGTDLPPNEIAGAAEYFEADAVILSATLPTQVPTVHETIEAIRQSSAEPVVVVGGLAFDSATGLWKEIGADALIPDIGSAVRLTNQLLAAQHN